MLFNAVTNNHEEDLTLIETQYSLHTNNVDKNSNTFLFQYNVYTNTQHDYFEVKVCRIYKISICEDYPSLNTFTKDTPKFTRRDAMMSIYTYIDHHNKKIEFDGCTACNIMVRSIKDEKALKSEGIGTIAFNLLIKYAKEYSQDDYKIKPLSFGYEDEKVQTNYDGTQVDNKIRRNNYYKNFGFTITDKAAIATNIAQIREHQGRKQPLEIEDAIKLYTELYESSIELKKINNDLVRKNINIKENYEYLKKEFDKRTKYLSFSGFIIVVILLWFIFK